MNAKLSLAAIVPTVCLALSGLAAVETQCDVIRNGRPAADIILPQSPCGVEQLAAEELRHHVERACGEAPAILGEDELGKSRQPCHFFIGATKAAAEAGLTARPFADDERLVRTAGGNLYLLGGDSAGPRAALDDLMQPAARGTLYAVYDFLENELGVKWIWPGETGEVVPRRKALSVGEIDRRGREPLDCRFYFGMGKEPLQVQFLQRHRVGKRVNRRINHAFGKWWGRFGAKHPEYFALLPDGTRRPLAKSMGAERDVTMCVSQPELWKAIVADWLPRYRRDGTGRFPVQPWVNCCENDSPGMCTCEACRAWDGPDRRFSTNPYWSGSGKADLSYGGRFARLANTMWGESATEKNTLAPASLSDRYANFYNHVLAEARKQVPEARVIGYAYSNYVEPPMKTRVDPGVVIEYVPRSYFPYGRAESETFRRNWLGWRKAGARDMTLRPNYTHALGSFPVDCGRAIVDDFAFAYTNGMIGCSFDSLMGAWSAAAMSHYALTRAFRDPLRGYEKARADVVSAFGPAAREANAYFDFIEKFSTSWTKEAFEKTRSANRMAGGILTGGHNRQTFILGDFYPDRFFTKAYALLDAAKDAAKGDAEVLARVEFLRKGIRNTELTRATRIAEKAWDADPKNPEKKAALAAAYAAMNDYRASIKGECVFSMAVALRSENGQMGWNKKAALAAEVESK